MSDSDLSDAPSISIPPDFELENSLRREVNRAKQNDDEATLRQIRAASEKKLGLPDGFYKDDNNGWKNRSKDIVQDQYDNEKDVPSSPDLKARKQAVHRPRPLKRKSSEPSSPPPKKRKATKDPDTESSSLSDVQSASEPAPKPKKAAKTSKPGQPALKKKLGKSKPTIISDEEESEESNANNDAAGSESEMSVVLDEEPKPKKKSKSISAPSKQKPKPAKSKAAADDDPDQAEIKRLQGWLVKCGIRKVWGAYLKPYETPKAKIKHLKDMLTDVGMTGRYSQEKAASIREARELAEDIAAVQEGDQRWGTGGNESNEEDDEGQAKSRGRLQRGRAHYDFLSSDGEETS